MRRVSQPQIHFSETQQVFLRVTFYTRAFQIMTDVGSMEIMSIMADTTNKIAEGEVLQLCIAITRGQRRRVFEGHLL